MKDENNASQEEHRPNGPRQEEPRSEKPWSKDAVAYKSREKNLGLIVLALLFVIIFWNSFWFLTKFLLAFIVVYIVYLAYRKLRFNS